MAHTKEQWKEAKFLWEVDKPLSYISKQTNISVAQISKKAKAQNWKKETKGNELKPLIKEYDREKEKLEAKGNDIVSKMSTLEDYEITLLDKVIQDETGNKSLLFSTANLALIRKNQMLTKNSKTILKKVDYFDETGKKIKSDMEETEIPLSPTDYKILDEGIDKNAVTLEIAPRHSNSQVNIQNTNAQQTINKIEREIIG